MSYARPDTTTLNAASADAGMVVIGVLHEAGIETLPLGANQVAVRTADLARLDKEQRAEVAKLAGGLPPEPATDPSTPPGDGGSEPPRSGAGSGREAWAAYATGLGLVVDTDLSRDQIIELVEAHR